MVTTNRAAIVLIDEVREARESPLSSAQSAAKCLKGDYLSWIFAEPLWHAVDGFQPFGFGEEMLIFAALLLAQSVPTGANSLTAKDRTEIDAAVKDAVDQVKAIADSTAAQVDAREKRIAYCRGAVKNRMPDSASEVFVREHPEVGPIEFVEEVCGAYREGIIYQLRVENADLEALKRGAR